MAAKSPYDKPCDYKGCTDPAYRHFWMHHFCNEHNKHLREKAQKERPTDLDEFIDAHTD